GVATDPLREQSRRQLPEHPLHLIVEPLVQANEVLPGTSVFGFHPRCELRLVAVESGAVDIEGVLLVEAVRAQLTLGDDLFYNGSREKALDSTEAFAELWVRQVFRARPRSRHFVRFSHSLVYRRVLLVLPVTQNEYRRFDRTRRKSGPIR